MFEADSLRGFKGRVVVVLDGLFFCKTEYSGFLNTHVPDLGWGVGILYLNLAADVPAFL